MSSETSSWSPMPGIDTHLSMREGLMVKKRSIIASGGHDHHLFRSQ